MKISPFFHDLRSAYQAEIDDLTQDSEGKDVLRKRLAQKRSCAHPQTRVGYGFLALEAWRRASSRYSWVTLASSEPGSKSPSSFSQSAAARSKSPC